MQTKTIQEWKPGNSRRWGLVLCCDVCGSASALINRTMSSRVHQRVCVDCSASKKEVTDAAARKATVVSVY